MKASYDDCDVQTKADILAWYNLHCEEEREAAEKLKSQSKGKGK